MKEIVIVLQLLGGLALLFPIGALIGHLFGLDKKMEKMQKERWSKNSARSQQKENK